MEEPKPREWSTADPLPVIPIADIEAKQTELLDIKRQLEFQLNGVVNQLHLIDQLLKPKPLSIPDNTI